MVITLRSGQLAYLIQESGAFVVVQIAGNKGTTVINREFVKDDRLHTRHSPRSYPVRKQTG